MRSWTRARRWWAAASDAWQSQLWPVPAIGVGLSVLLGVVLPRLDARIDDSLPPAVTAYLFSGGPEAARTVLSAVAGSLITATSLTFSLTVVTLQLASTQFSPRLLRTFTRDRVVHVSLSLLLATFVYALTVLRTVRASLSDQSAFVPQLSVTVAFLLALVSVMTLVVFLAHLARQIRIESVIRAVHADTAATMRHMLGAGDPRTAGSSRVPSVPADATPLSAGSSGFFTMAEASSLLSAAIAADAVVYVDRLPGDSLIAGTPVAVAWPRRAGSTFSPDVRTALRDNVADAVQTGFERTATQDVAFGIRQLVDVAVKAVSPGINDPTTAVHDLGHISALLCEAVDSDFDPRLLCDPQGDVRVILRRPGFADLLELSLTQPRRYGASDAAVLSRIASLLREVAWASSRPADHLAVAEQAERLAGTVDRQDFDDTEREQLHAQIRAVRLALTGRWPMPSS